jgi:hypothetical protein
VHIVALKDMVVKIRRLKALAKFADTVLTKLND